MGDIVRLVRRDRFIGWYIRFRDVDGRRKMRASHQPTRQLARRLLIEIEARVARNQVGIPEPAPPAPTLSALVERYLVEYERPRIKDLATYRRDCRTALRRALPILGARPVDRMATSEIVRLRATLSKRYAAGSVRLTLAFLSSVLSWAKKQGIVAQNPVQGVERPQAAELIEYLTKDEARALLRCSKRRLATEKTSDRLRQVCIALALHSGLRKGELFGLRWCDLDLEAQRLTVARSYKGTPKSGNPRHLRLPRAVLPLIGAWKKECPKSPAGLVFPVPGSEQRGATKDAMLGLPDLLAEAGCRPMKRPWHALRHTFASHYMMRGGNILALQKILGHADIKMTLIYAHLAPDYLAQEMERVKY